MRPRYLVHVAGEGVRRRELLAGGASAAAVGALGGAGTPLAKDPSLHRRAPKPKLYDVAVVGAGLARLNAATAVRSAGRSVVVLEASLQDPLVEPAGSLYFASSDLSPQWPGYMDGAIRSGEQAAEAVLASLSI
jgi:hypothetical protein